MIESIGKSARTLVFGVTLAILSQLMMGGCGGSSGGGGVQTYTVSGTISGDVAQGILITLSDGQTTTTDAGGQYSFAGLSDGLYMVVPSLTGYTFTNTSESVTVLGSDITDVNFISHAVPSTYSISGTVSGDVAQDVLISLSNGQDTTTDAGGTYTFTGLADGSYTVTPSLAGYTFANTSESVTVAGADIANVNFTSSLNLVDRSIDDLSMTLKPISSGSFTMGSPASEAYRNTEEGPQHEVTISNPFWMASTEVSIDQFRTFLIDAAGPTPAPSSTTADDSPSPPDTGTISTDFPLVSYAINNPVEGVNFASSNCPILDDATYSLAGNNFSTNGNQPMIEISYVAATNFCTWLTEREGFAGRLPAGYEFRLPTEAEWEYCCRAGSTTAFSYGADSTTDGTTYTNLGDYAWYYGTASGVVGEAHTQIAAGKTANAWGLYDLHGNVHEWCYDWYSSSYYTSTSKTDPTGPSSGTFRVVRSGNWSVAGQYCRSANRVFGLPSGSSTGTGFRVVLAPVLP